MIIPTNKDLSREWFLQKLVKFARDKYKTIEIDGEKKAVVLLSDLIEFTEKVELKDYANKL